MRKSPILSAVLFTMMLMGFMVPPSAAVGAPGREKKCVERDVTLDQLPAAVKTAILEAAGTHDIRELEEVTRPDGVVVYEAEWLVDGKEVEIEVMADGTILDGDDDEDDGEDEDDDDGMEDEDDG